MVSTLQKNIKNEQLAQYLIYILRKWKQNTLIQKFENIKLTSKPKPISWADVSDDDELPEVPWETNDKKITFIH